MAEIDCYYHQSPLSILKNFEFVRALHILFISFNPQNISKVSTSNQYYHQFTGEGITVLRILESQFKN